MKTKIGFWFLLFLPCGLSSYGQIVKVPAASASTDELAHNREGDVAELIADGVPEWAADCVEDLILTRLRAAATASKLFMTSADREVVVQALRPDEALVALDAEVDLIATAMLALEAPNGVIALYDRWYPHGNERTLAAPLLQAQAYRMSAWHLVDPPPGTLLADPVPDRMKLFEAANRRLAKAWLGLHLHTETLRSGESKLQTNRIGGMIQFGRISPVWETDPAPPRQPVAAFHAIDYAKSYLLWEARIARELGDLVYRETGSPAQLVERQGNGEKASQHTALGYYSVARDALYLARLIDLQDPELAREAQLVKKRTEWIRDGIGFGGQDLLKFEPYAQATYITHSLEELDSLLGELRNHESRRAATATGVATWLGNMRENKASRDLLRGAFATEARRQIQSRIVDLIEKCTGIHSRQLVARVEKASNKLDRLVAGFGNDLAIAQYRGELERFRLQLLTDLLTQLQDLERLGGLGAEIESNADYQSVTGFVTSLRGNDPIQSQINNAWRSITTGKTTMRTRVDQLRARIDIAHVDVQRRLRAIRLTDLDRQKKGISLRLESLNAELVTNDKKLKDDFIKFKGDSANVLAGLDVNLVNQITPRLKAEVSQLANRARQAREIVIQVQQKLTQLKHLVEDIKKARRDLEAAYDKTVSIIEIAKNIPVTVTAGMATGTMLDTGDAIASSAEAVLNKLVAVFEGRISSQELNQAIEEAEERVNGYLSKAEHIESELGKKKNELNDRIDQIRGVERLRQEYDRQVQHLKAEQDAITADMSATTSDLTRVSGEIERLGDEDLKDQLAQARLTEKSSVAAYEQAVLERDHRVRLIAAQIVRIVQRDSESQQAAQLFATYRKSLDENILQLKDAQNDAEADQKTSDEKVLSAIEVELASLQAELEAMNKPANRIVAADFVRSLTPALALSSARIDPADIAAKKDRANDLILRSARWLYVLGGDSKAIALGSPASSLHELELARTSIVAEWDSIRASYSNTNHKVFVLSVDQQNIERLMTDGRLAIRTKATWPAVMGDSIKPKALGLDSTYYLPDRTVWSYSNPVMVRGLPTYYLTRAAAETNGAGILTSGWLICQWQTPDGQTIGQPEPFVIPAIFRQGPIRVRWDGIVRSLPMAFDRNFGVNELVFDDFSRIENFKRFIDRLPDVNAQFLDEPFRSGQNQPHFFGLGLDNNWVFELRYRGCQEGKSVDRLAKKSDFADGLRLARVDLVLTYLFPVVRRQQHIASQTSAAAPVPNLKFLASLPAPAQVAPMPLKKSEPSNAAIRAAIDSELNAILPSEHTTKVAEKALKKTGNADAQTSILQPINVEAQFRAAMHLLRLLVTSLENDYATKLRAAATRLDGLGSAPNPLADDNGNDLSGGDFANRKPMPLIVNMTSELRLLNNRYKSLDQSITSLDDLINILNGVDLDEASGRQLNELLMEPVPRDVWKRQLIEAIASEQAGSNAETPSQQQIISFVITQLRAHIEGAVPGTGPTRVDPKALGASTQPH
jgi:hypothetical protein